MPSSRKQFNCRPDDETWSLIENVRQMARDKLGLELTDTQILRRSVTLYAAELANLHGGPKAPDLPAKKPAQRGPGRPRKS